MTLLKSIAIDPVTGGFVFSGGALQFVEGMEAKRQQAQIRFKTVQGEFFLDKTLGIPYFTDILIKSANPKVLLYVFTKALQDLGLRQVQVTFYYDKPNRKLTGGWSAKDPNGGSVAGTF